MQGHSDLGAVVQRCVAQGSLGFGIAPIVEVLAVLIRVVLQVVVFYGSAPLVARNDLFEIAW